MNSYNKNDLDELAIKTGFLRDQLEKVIRLSDVLRCFREHDLLRNSLVLKGGTAINLTIFRMPRLSVDIDLDYCKDVSKEEMFDDRKYIYKAIESIMTPMSYMLNPRTKSPHTIDSLVYEYRNAVGNRDVIKIEINYSDRCHVLPIQEQTVSIDILGNITVKTLSPIELFASKIKALTSRAAVRDIYDVYGMIKANLFSSEGEKDLLRKIFVFYNAVGSSCKAEEVTLNFEKFNHIEGLEFHQVRDYLLPVLRKSEKFDFNSAKDEVIKFLNEFLVFSSEERLFIEHFNHRTYRPDILFKDNQIVERIANHPMALWKCRPAL